MTQGLLVWLLTMVLSYLMINALRLRFKFIESRILYILFFYHSLLAAAYYMYALFNPSDSNLYYEKVLMNYRGLAWIDFFGTSTMFIEFVGYPFIQYMGFSYESIMVLFSFFGFIGFLFFYVFFKERILTKYLIFGVSLLLIIFFLPNLHFWASSFGKGALIFCGFGIFFFAINSPTKRWWAILLGGFLIYMVRPHIFYVILIAITIGYSFSSRGVGLLPRIAILIIAGSLSIYLYDDVLSIAGLEEDSLFDPSISMRAKELAKATSGIDLTSYSLPEKLFAFWFRPLFFDAPGALGLIVSFENLFYLGIFLTLLRPRALGYLLRADAITKTALLTFFGVSFALAQISGNLGLAMRQKSQVMILMMFVILKYFDEQKMVQLKKVFLREKASARFKQKSLEALKS